MKKRLTLFITLLATFVLLITGCSSSPVKPLAEANGRLMIHYLNVGQGDCTLIQTPSGKNMLIDAGNPDDFESIDQYLQANHVEKLEVVMATHPHSDHIGSMTKILEKYEIGALYAPKVNHNTKTYQKLLETAASKDIQITPVQSGITIDLDPAVGIELFSPVYEKSYSDLNSYSPITKLTYGERAFIFTGDAETDNEEDALAYGGSRLDADVLKVGHHGSETSTSKAFFNAVSPTACVISVGKDNKYGHPDESILSMLSGTDIYRTDRQGTIVAICDGDTIEFITEENASQNQTESTGTPANPTEITYIGNKNTQKFHRSDCSGLPKRENAVSFSSRDEALSQGYTPCSRCNP